MENTQKKIIKRYKVFVFKCLAVVIGICYLANPLQNQISSISHEISHIFEIPDAVIDHAALTFQENTSHHYHEHAHVDNKHEHRLIDLLDSIFSASDESDQEESILIDVKLDKHITVIVYPSKRVAYLKIPSNFFTAEKGKIKGYSKVLEEPPQQFSI